MVKARREGRLRKRMGVAVGLQWRGGGGMGAEDMRQLVSSDPLNHV